MFYVFFMRMLKEILRSSFDTHQSDLPHTTRTVHQNFFLNCYYSIGKCLQTTQRSCQCVLLSLPWRRVFIIITQLQTRSKYFKTSALYSFISLFSLRLSMICGVFSNSSLIFQLIFCDNFKSPGWNAHLNRMVESS